MRRIKHTKKSDSLGHVKMGTGTWNFILRQIVSFVMTGLEMNLLQRSDYFMYHHV